MFECEVCLLKEQRKNNATGPYKTKRTERDFFVERTREDEFSKRLPVYNKSATNKEEKRKKQPDSETQKIPDSENKF
jgi:hypothetical protein